MSLSSHKVDSVVIRETVRDTVVTIRPDKSVIRALLECDSLGQVRLRELIEYQAGERVRPPKIGIRDNVLTATAEVDSLTIYMRLKDRYERHVSQSAEKQTVVVEVNRLTWWQELWIRAGRVLATALVGLIAFKLGKPKILQLWQTITKLLKRN